MSFEIEGDFFCIFKTGDNIRYNLSVLEKLYEFFDDPHTKDKKLLLKPITIILVSIIEAILHDFHVRVRTNIHEGVFGLKDNVINYIRNKEVDEFANYIESSKRHDLFKLAYTNFYEKLDKLRVIRNRIHIQNKWGYEPANDYALFTDSNKILAELCLEVVVKTMHNNHPRPSEMSDYVGNLKFPWKERLKRRL